MIYDENGWMFPSPDNKPNNDVHIISEDTLKDMYYASLEDDAWATRVRNEVIYRDQHLESARDYIIDDFRIKNAGGTVIYYPFGQRIITFPSKRHFFRGENQVYEESVPTLNRKIHNMNQKSAELYRAVANMRIEQFSKFIWQFNIVPYWMAKLSDVNNMALAQHYGFETCLMDLTNDFMTALFFATCYYDEDSGEYRPLTEKMINTSENTQYGMIFHTPNWVIDFLQPGGSMEWFYHHRNDKRTELYLLDSGDVDGMAFQIGYQPLHRCHSQNGYIFPMRNSVPLQKDTRFEKLRFRQSAKLSNKVYELMEQGKKIFPQEGINAAQPILRVMQENMTFSESDFDAAFYSCDKTLFETKEDLRRELSNYFIGEKQICFKEEEIEYTISDELSHEINSHYDGVDLLQQIGGMIHQYPEDAAYRRQMCIKIYGKEI